MMLSMKPLNPLAAAAIVAAHAIAIGLFRNKIKEYLKARSTEEGRDDYDDKYVHDKNVTCRCLDKNWSD
jgi:hypothetical protein